MLLKLWCGCALLIGVDKNEFLWCGVAGQGPNQATTIRCKNALASGPESCNIGVGTTISQFWKPASAGFLFLWCFLAHRISFRQAWTRMAGDPESGWPSQSLPEFVVNGKRNTI